MPLHSSLNFSMNPSAASRSRFYWPWLTTAAVTVSLLLALLPTHLQQALVFDRQTVLEQHIWQLFTSHFIHGDVSHLMWDVAGLALIGTWLERSSRTAWLVAWLLGLISVNAFLLSDFSTVRFYCGLSGILNTLLFVLLWQWRRAYRPIVIISVACGALLKLGIELAQDTAIFTQTLWPPYPEAHLAGTLGAMLYISAAILHQASVSPDKKLIGFDGQKDQQWDHPTRSFIGCRKS